MSHTCTCYSPSTIRALTILDFILNNPKICAFNQCIDPEYPSLYHFSRKVVAGNIYSPIITLLKFLKPVLL